MCCYCHGKVWPVTSMDGLSVCCAINRVEVEGKQFNVVSALKRQQESCEFYVRQAMKARRLLIDAMVPSYIKFLSGLIPIQRPAVITNVVLLFLGEVSGQNSHHIFLHFYRMQIVVRLDNASHLDWHCLVRLITLHMLWEPQRT